MMQLASTGIWDGTKNARCKIDHQSIRRSLQPEFAVPFVLASTHLQQIQLVPLPQDPRARENVFSHKSQALS